MEITRFYWDGIKAFWVGECGNFGLTNTHTVTVFGPIVGDYNRIAIRIDCCSGMMRTVRPETLHETESECNEKPCRNRKDQSK